MGDCISGTEPPVRTGRVPFSSVEEFGWSADETGDELPLGVIESENAKVSEPTADNTDVGDWFSCSETDKFRDVDLLGSTGFVLSLTSVLDNLRG